MEKLRKSLDLVAGDLTKMIAGAEFACALFELPRPKTFAETARLLGFVEASAAMPECDRQAFCDPVWDSVGDVIEVVEKGERFSKLRTAFDSAFVESAWNASLHECRTILARRMSLVVPGVQLTLPGTSRASEFMLERPVAEDSRAASSAGRWFDCRASRAPIVRGYSSVWTRSIRYYVAEGTLRLDEVGKLHNVVGRISEGKSSGRCARSFGASDLVGRR